MGATVKKSGPGLAPLALSLEQLRHAEVLIGIPQSTTQRKNSPINNASLLWVQSKGSPLKKIPPRPVLEPSIEKNNKLITPHLAAAVKATLDKNPTLAEQELNLAGIVASNGAKRYVLEKINLTPNAPSTIAHKRSDVPLVDTNKMVGAITHVVRVKE